jgi:hypothetical protein
MSAPDFDVFLQGIEEFVAGAAGQAEAFLLAAEPTILCSPALLAILTEKYQGKTVAKIISLYRLGRITKAPLPPGGPGWEQILRMLWEEVEEAARQGKPWARTVKKLLTKGTWKK